MLVLSNLRILLVNFILLEFLQKGFSIERRRSSGVRNLPEVQWASGHFCRVGVGSFGGELSVIISEPKRVIAGLITYVESKNSGAQERIA
ncbi:MAG TPA: hypothetical protein VGM58_10945 [Verrucomicrobiae bacterium]|jgi:hypothetical protein